MKPARNRISIHGILRAIPVLIAIMSIGVIAPIGAVASAGAVASNGAVASATSAPRIPIAPINFATTTAIAQDAQDDHAEDDHADDHGDDDHDAHEKDLGQQRAANLAVAEPPAWYSTVVWSAAILFILAATLGSAAIILKGPEPPDPADEHAHGDGHGHGGSDHGHH